MGKNSILLTCSKPWYRKHPVYLKNIAIISLKYAWKNSYLITRVKNEISDLKYVFTNTDWKERDTTVKTHTPGDPRNISKYCKT